MHHLKVVSTPFEKLKNKTKVIESRLYDEKRKLIKIGDDIEFTNNETGEHLVLKVIDLYFYPTFKDLAEAMGPSLFGHETVENVVTELEQFYTIDNQKEFGVVGIRLA